MRRSPMSWAALLVLLPVAALAGVPEGLEALKRNDFPAATRELRGPAEQGDAEAQYRIGLMHEFGKGYPRDMQQALAWLRKAATQGHTAAQVELGVIYTGGDGVPADAVQSVDWFRKAALQGSATAQYNLGMMIAKGSGVRRDDAQAVAWFRKAADQGFALAQFTLGVAYENGEGVAKDPVLAFADYAIAARSGNVQYVEHRDAMRAQLDAVQLREAQSLAAAWAPGSPMPVRGAAAQSASAAPVAARGPERCSASGTMDGNAFTMSRCAVALLPDQHSVTIWFNEDAITPAERTAFETSAYAEDKKDGKPRTQLVAMFCPGGGAVQASANAVRSVDVNTNHAKAPLAGMQWVADAPKEVKVERMSGNVEPGGSLSGRIVGNHGKTSWTLDFDVALPMHEAAAGMTCGK
jgi:hypothetical protein